MAGSSFFFALFAFLFPAFALATGGDAALVCSQQEFCSTTQSSPLLQKSVAKVSPHLSQVLLDDVQDPDYDTWALHTPNIEIEDARPEIGGWGGSCTCPDGQVYWVGDNKNSNCKIEKACDGGIPGKCYKKQGNWSFKKVQCAMPLEDVVVDDAQPKIGGWGGSCTCPNGKVYWVGDNKNSHCKIDKACAGGTPGKCYKKQGNWSFHAVHCKPEERCDKECYGLLPPGGHFNTDGRSSWDYSCYYAACGDCPECKAAQCKTHCSKMTAPWSWKCTTSDCQTCEECQSD